MTTTRFGYPSSARKPRTPSRHQWCGLVSLSWAFLGLTGCASTGQDLKLCPARPEVVELAQERVYVSLPRSLVEAPAEPRELDPTATVGALWQTEQALREWGRKLAAKLEEAGAVAGTPTQ